MIRARAREAVQRAKDGIESSFSNQGPFKYTTAPADDDLVVPTNRRKGTVWSGISSFIVAYFMIGTSSLCRFDAFTVSAICP